MLCDFIGQSYVSLDTRFMYLRSHPIWSLPFNFKLVKNEGYGRNLPTAIEVLEWMKQFHLAVREESSSRELML